MSCSRTNEVDTSAIRATAACIQSTIEKHTAQVNSGDREAASRKAMVQVIQRISDDVEQIDSLLVRLADIKQTAGELQASIKRLNLLRDERKKRLAERTQESTSETSTFPNEFESCSLTQLCETVKQYERLFRLRFQRTNTDSLQLFFDGCADVLHLDIVCSCLLGFTKSGRFEAVECSPPVPDFEGLVTHLNLTKDIRSFLILLRHRFCRYFELAATLSERIK
ncbi:unnamed protein product [Calicophoron daubneyi]|uniref:Kinetochore protein SPC25 n=1 Tax=Calicophoron daubneyi TaxID=300641 RepID=A0AAV2TVF8_CALDB